ncbi:1-acyl-sn-glycerol-3-phosphate acyltransferase [Flavobacterium terrigena]|uniref:1-acyl-sn-glycerol-3-phosphate acyltransferase n=1 Tax=Flavobacterium terrigena TaxID=402734 RepID=A0A1H6VBJ8_9FLAO|nr:1-acyl-sn-glycerol-3-phosphate acyltransferase [Flavobacterium terrigena]SEJ01953.1 1-acyl-sn-glycerol-3-phosphate acyltransferase [Flavobacterium terrigena]
MSKFDKIRPYYDAEVNDAIRSSINHPMMKALMDFAYPNVEEAVWKEQLLRTHSIRDFQINFAYHAIKKILEKSSDGLTTSGFEKLDPNTSYFFISNHRDIILDTSLLNVCLHEHGLVMTASAIGDNLVKKDFLLKLSKLNRNFLVQRNLSPRELLVSSKLLSEYMYSLISKENRSVWIAQREGRTKDGNDATHSGVLKMMAMASDEKNSMDFFKKVRIVPVSISYEYDPTDALKMPQLMAEANDQIYLKEKNEDFITLLSGIIGQKKRIHIHVGDILEDELDAISAETTNSNKQMLALAQVIDDSILQSYKLWPTNYIAYDMMNNTTIYSEKYTEEEKQLFKRRLELRINAGDAKMKESFLAMYANPVTNKLKYQKIESNS